jgi:cbb3-type cytochrome oxidase maturation protein
MEIMFFIIPICVVIAIAFTLGFYWMTKNGQYDDLETPASRMLLDDKKINHDLVQNINTSTRQNKERK